MWMWHVGRSYRALVQDRSSLELRTVKIADNDVFYRREGLSNAEQQRQQNEYLTAVVSSQLRPGERYVPPGEFARFAEDAGQVETDLPCPRCRALLLWRETGIS
jgi:hypothetical protein